MRVRRPIRNAICNFSILNFLRIFLQDHLKLSCYPVDQRATGCSTGCPVMFFGVRLSNRPPVLTVKAGSLASLPVSESRLLVAWPTVDQSDLSWRGRRARTTLWERTQPGRVKKLCVPCLHTHSLLLCSAGAIGAMTFCCNFVFMAWRLHVASSCYNNIHTELHWKPQQRHTGNLGY